jgi:pyroglutamyl-peptidase
VPEHDPLYAPTRILVTAFEPFGGETTNPTVQILERLRGPPGTTVERLVLPVVFEQSLQRLEETLERFQPNIVLGLGQAGGRALVSLERVAINLNDARIPDNAGQHPVDTAVVEDGPAAYFSTLPVKRMLQTLLAAGIPAHVSQSAGTYVCNHVMYGLLHALAARHPHARGGFIHVPFLPEQAAKHSAPSLGLELLVQAVELCLEVACDPAPDIVLAAGTTH